MNGDNDTVLKAKAKAWMARDPDPTTRQQLSTLLRDGELQELRRRFRGRLEFGTAGLRAPLGAGPKGMNRLVVRQTSAGLGAYLAERVDDAKERGVVVAFDARRGSRVFAEDAACTFGAMGFLVHLFDREVPTPLCAFAVRELDAAAGVTITASHNPPEYNGYKVFWHTGAQIVPPHDAGIADAIDAAAKGDLPFCDAGRLRHDGRLQPLGDEEVERYLAGVARLSVHPSTRARKEMVIAYTPLHGVAARIAQEAMRRGGFAHLHTVAAQREPDGTFPTVHFPNPEEPGAMEAVLALGDEVGAHLCFANDPDGDRLGVAVRSADGQLTVLTGDRIGVLLGADRIESARGRGFVATTVVSSRLLPRIARAHGAECLVTLTGFKWLMDGALARMAQGARLLFAYEEALGYGVGDVVLDKDGISAMVAFAQMAAQLHERGQSVVDALEALYTEHGLHASRLRPIALEPGSASTGELLRRQPPAHIGGTPVQRVRDLSEPGGEPDALPPADVLIYELEDQSRVIVRPSGTEPKLKCYYEVVLPNTGPRAAAEAQQRLDALCAAHQEALKSLN